MYIAHEYPPHFDGQRESGVRSRYSWAEGENGDRKRQQPGTMGTGRSGRVVVC